jgi:hypothetical protein
LKRILGLSLGIFCLWGRATVRAVEIVPFSGFESDSHDQGFAMLGVGVDQRVAKNLSLSFLGMANYLYYRYRAGGQTVRAEAPGGEYLGGFKVDWRGNNYLSALGGGQRRETHYYGGNAPQTRGGSGGTAQVELNLQPLKWTTLNSIGVYVDKDAYKWSRFTLKNQLNNFDYARPWTFNGGIVGTFQGNHDYRARQGGLLAEVYHIPWMLSVAVHGGYKWDTSWGDGAYGALLIAKKF